MTHRVGTADGGPLRHLVLTVRFLCELAMLGALAYWGFHTFSVAASWLVGLGAPVAAAVIWGAFVSPKARWLVPVAVRLVIELVLFGAAAIALPVVDQTVLAVALGIGALATSLFNAATESHLTAVTVPSGGRC